MDSNASSSNQTKLPTRPLIGARDPALLSPSNTATSLLESVLARARKAAASRPITGIDVIEPSPLTPLSIFRSEHIIGHLNTAKEAPFESTYDPPDARYSDSETDTDTDGPDSPEGDEQSEEDLSSRWVVPASSIGADRESDVNNRTKETQRSLEEKDVQAAISNSLEKTSSATNSLGPLPQLYPRRGSQQLPHDNEQMAKDELDQRIEYFKNRSAMELPLLNFPDADTLVYIDPPAQLACRDDACYSDYLIHHSSPHRMHSSKIRASGSPSLIDLLSPTKQFRTMRRRRLAGQLPPGIKYCLDLTPPSEGEDAVFLTTELCCSLGVRLWFETHARWGISNTLVGGQDEFEPARKVDDEPEVSNEGPSNLQVPERAESSVNFDKAGGPLGGFGHMGEAPAQAVDRSIMEINAKASPRNPSIVVVSQEYTAVRHRIGIERLLHAIEGSDPQIDSACKLWTVFALTKYFDCPAVAVDYIVRWIYAMPNTLFIEVLPEVSSKIADGLCCANLGRDSFAILVGEEALAIASRNADSVMLQPDYSIHGRRKEDLHEMHQTRVEYASKKFMERVSARFQSLVDDEMAWLMDVPELKKLMRGSDNCSSPRKSAFTHLLRLLKAFVRGRIYWILCRNHHSDLGSSLKNVKGFKATESSLFPIQSHTSVYWRLSPKERVFTRSFWKILQHENFVNADSNLATNMRDAWLAPNEGWTPHASALFNAKVFERVDREELGSAASRLNWIEREFGAKGRSGEYYEDTLLRKAPQPYSTQAAANATDEHDLKRRRTSGPSAEALSQSHPPGSSIELPFRNKNLEEMIEQSRRPRAESGGTIDAREQPLVAKGNIDVSSLDDEQEPALEIRGGNNDGQCPPESTPVASIDDPLHCFTTSAPFHFNEHSYNTDGTITPFLQNRSERLSERWEFENNVRRSPEKLLPKQFRPWADDEPSRIAVTISKPGDSRDLESSSLGRDGRFSTSTENPALSFYPEIFLKQVMPIIRGICGEMLAPSDSNSRLDPLHLQLTDTLVCLEEEEWKYLPLWAGGNDDETGGVFDDTVPFADAGPSGPGPKYHTGVNSTASSEFEMVGSSRGSDTSFNTSTVVEDGFSDHLCRGKVYSESDNDSLWGEMMVHEQDSTAMSIDTDMGKGKDKAADPFDEESLWGEVMARKQDTAINAKGKEKQKASEDFDFDNGEEDNEDADTATIRDEEDWDGGDDEPFYGSTIDDDDEDFKDSMVLV
ncbi:MAG: hypothetical protein M1827_002483 [Pycnora praestabilis]|nr:MAG: hypothetical protein M1827_002483 [Pycnora praestabilis]